MAKQTKNNSTGKGGGKATTDAAKSTAAGKDKLPVGVVEKFILPSGLVVLRKEFKGKHIKEALRVADGDTSILPFAMISQTMSFDGKNVVAEDIEEMDGKDVMMLLGKIGSFL